MTNTAFISVTCLQPRERNDRCELASHLTEAYLIGFLMVFRLVHSYCKGLLAWESVKILTESSVCPSPHLPFGPRKWVSDWDPLLHTVVRLSPCFRPSGDSPLAYHNPGPGAWPARLSTIGLKSISLYPPGGFLYPSRSALHPASWT